ncbi:MAG TPA: SDR family NAD(P)-dependent oxidoreductase [Rhizomicrobium sp.]|nr:SDR family NAD(P)-dependent oxidoreductase [Rhizomicrobium sp.]
MELRDTGAVITGGASGIGFGIARALGKRGGRVILADIEGERAQASARSLGDEGIDALGVAHDVISEESWNDLAELAFHRWGKVDLLFNNAGVGGGTTTYETPTRIWDWIFAVDTRGIFLGVRAFAPRMLASGSLGRIVNTGSEHSLGLPPGRRGGIAPYTAAKHAVMGYTLAMRHDFRKTSLSAAIICPGPVQSDVWDSFRNRHPQFGGPRHAPSSGAQAMAGGLPAGIAGERIADQIASDAFFIFTNGPEESEVADGYAREITAALAAFRTRYPRA